MLRQTIVEHIGRALEALNPSIAAPNIRLEYAREEQFGDYACTIAMDRSIRDLYAAEQAAFKNPRNFAGAIQERLQSDPGASAFFERVEVAGPGFLNLFVAPQQYYTLALAAAAEGGGYGRSKRSDARNIIFEFVSANPTGPLNVVSARAAALGDCCCNLLEAAGDQVHREFYVNDYGNQVNLLGRSCLLRYLESRGALLKFAERETPPDEQAAEDALSTPAAHYKEGPGLRFPAEGYHGEYIKEAVAAICKSQPRLELSAELLAELVDRSARTDLAEDFTATETLQPVAERFGLAAIAYFLESQRADLDRFRVRFDNFFSERELHMKGAVLEARTALGTQTKESEGKVFFRSSEYGDDKDRVIVREDGRPTYLLADIAYHKSKADRGFSHIFNVWGPDHHGYIKRLAGAMQAMGFPQPNFQVLIAQQVNLLEQGKPLRMSKRAGRLITMRELIEEIPVDVSRYFFVMRAFESHLDYDLAEARDTSEKNPYYYVAYAHARIASIFQAAKERGLEAEQQGELQIELTPERRRLLVLAARFPEEVQDAAASLEPHRLLTYLYHLATALSQFYAPRENRIIQQSPEIAAQLLAILAAVKLSLANGLRLLGMDAPERMTREEDGAQS
ncbi:MAG: arginine--tRNA ligase [Leptospirales bacterium]|nr:arginine--tRNA ligase [Leptospirales bacterium]